MMRFYGRHITNLSGITGYLMIFLCLLMHKLILKKYNIIFLAWYLFYEVSLTKKEVNNYMSKII